MSEPLDTVRRLIAATNAHELDAMVACFAEDYELEMPAHPARGFHGREQVRRNWEQIFGFVPDIAVELLRSSVDGETVWTEQEMRGQRRDGSLHLMRGPLLFGVRDGLIRWGRFYLELVDDSTQTVADVLEPRAASR